MLGLGMEDELLVLEASVCEEASMVDLRVHILKLEAIEQKVVDSAASLRVCAREVDKQLPPPSDRETQIRAPGRSGAYLCWVSHSLLGASVLDVDLARVTCGR